MWEAIYCHWCQGELPCAYTVSSSLGGIPEKEKHPSKSVLKKSVVRVRLQWDPSVPNFRLLESGTVTPK